MTDKEIIKALECCTKSIDNGNCGDCPLLEKECIRGLPKYALDLINRQQAEIEELERVISYLEGVCESTPDKVRAEAIKEFADRLKEKIGDSHFQNYGLAILEIHDLVKEMVGEE